MLIVLAVALLLAIVATGLVIAHRRHASVPTPSIPGTGASSVPSAPSAPGDAPEITEPV